LIDHLNARESTTSRTGRRSLQVTMSGMGVVI
jgi:hypothetical protein